MPEFSIKPNPVTKHTGRSRIPGTTFLAFCALLSACAPALLNSERIEQQFGSYGVEILESSDSHRVSNLYNTDAAGKVCRTLALVLFQDSADNDIRSEQEQILAGGSIGAVFKAAGWTINKVNLKLGTIDVGKSDLLIKNLMHIPVPNELAVHIYNFELARKTKKIRYATIVEIHHPDYLRPDDLRRLYGSLPSESIPDTKMTTILDQVGRILAH